MSGYGPEWRPVRGRQMDRGGPVAKGGVDDAMFCEACGTHRDQLGVAGQDIQLCPDCGRATCANCWNQVAGGCLSCRAFALPFAPPVAEPVIVAAAAPPPPAKSRSRRKAAAVVAAAAATPADQVAPTVAATPVAADAAKTPFKAPARRFSRGTATMQPDPVVTAMPGVVETRTVPVAAAAAATKRHWDVERFGTIRLGRVIRASAIGSVLAVSVAAVVFAGVIRLAPSGAADGSGAQETVAPGGFETDPGGGTIAPTATDPAVVPTITNGPGGPGGTGGAPGTSTPGGGGADPTQWTSGSTPKPGATATPKPTAGATATPTPTPAATPTQTPTPTEDPPPTSTPTPTEDPPPTPTPTPTEDPPPTSTPTPTEDPPPTPTPTP